jgi:hypothetical protein
MARLSALALHPIIDPLLSLSESFREPLKFTTLGLPPDVVRKRDQ